MPNPVVTSLSLAGFAVSVFAVPFVERFSGLGLGLTVVAHADEGYCLVDFPVSTLLAMLAWRVDQPLPVFGVLGTLWRYLLGYNARCFFSNGSGPRFKEVADVWIYGEQVSGAIKYDRRIAHRPQFKNRRAYGYTASPVAITSSEPIVLQNRTPPELRCSRVIRRKSTESKLKLWLRQWNDAFIHDGVEPLPRISS